MRKIAAVIFSFALLGGCAVVAEKTNFLNDDDVRKASARAVGMQPDEIKLVSRNTEGTNTYAVIQTKSGKNYACTINGGNILTAGMINPPTCNLK